MTLETGARLGPYEIVAPLASGGMGDVYLAHDPRLGREVAVKVLPESLSNDPQALDAFAREARAVAALSHPNILSIHDYGVEGTIAYSVTEYLEGETLRSRIAKSPIPWRKAVEIGAAISDGLAAAHSKGIVHRDLKPENIFLTADGRVKILDFGIAQLKEDPGNDDDLSSRPTAKLDLGSSGVVGTAGYMSPEQLKVEPVAETSDIFSFGCLLFEMIAGKPAFLRRTVVESLSAILTENPQIWEVTGGTIPPDLGRLIDRCLEKNPAERFQSSRDLSFALRAIGTASQSALTWPKLRVKSWLVPAALLLLLAAVLIYVFSQPAALSHSPQKINSLAILPFINATNDPGAEYLSDGVTESLINSLSQLPRLKVMSRTSVFHYKQKDPDPKLVGRELNVQAVVVGRITEVAKRLVVSVELVDARDSSHIWGEQYNAERADIFSVQESISERISEQLRLELTGEAEQRMIKRYTENPEAYDLYLRGRYEWNRRSADGLYKAIGFFNRAIAVDPKYALAYAGLADCYNLLDIWAGLPTKETFPKAKIAARQALALDDELAEAHTSLAYALHNYDRNWIDAEREYKRAIELKPNYATAHQWYSEFLTARGRFDEAISQVKKGLELDPLSPIINAVAAWDYTMARRYREAISQATRTTQLFPDFLPGFAYLGLAQLESGHYDEAVTALEHSQKIQDIVVIHSWEIRAHIRRGDHEVVKKAMADLELRGRKEYLPPYYLAALYGALGDRERAFRELNRALDENSSALVWLRVDPGMDVLRDDPRFGAMLAKAGF